MVDQRLQSSRLDVEHTKVLGQIGRLILLMVQEAGPVKVIDKAVTIVVFEIF
jgi:hypothetical protein